MSSNTARSPSRCTLALSLALSAPAPSSLPSPFAPLELGGSAVSFSPADTLSLSDASAPALAVAEPDGGETSSESGTYQLDDSSDQNSSAPASPEATAPR
eukprot:4582141-Pleurochrysis_carterae.AAC.1